MVNNRAAITRSCFLGLLTVGIGLLLIGLTVETIMAIISLDRVLTPEELANPGKRASTIALLKKAEGNRWLVWSMAGFLVIGLSGIGLWSTNARVSPRVGASVRHASET